MFNLIFMRTSRVGSPTCLQQMRHIGACNLHTLRSHQKIIQNYLPPIAQEKLTISALQVPSQELHSSGVPCMPNDSQSSYVFRIKGKVPSGLKTEGRFDFFSLRSLFSTPAPYMLYGLGGLIPFMSAPIYMHLTGEFSPSIAHAQLVYGACILSFLGGVSWGEHLNRPAKASLQSLSYSIGLPLVAWPAVLLYPNPTSFLIMTGGIIFAGVKDTRDVFYPKWFKNLRFLLSSLVAVSLSATLLFRFTLESKGSGKDDDNDEENSD